MIVMKFHYNRNDHGNDIFPYLPLSSLIFPYLPLHLPIFPRFPYTPLDQIPTHTTVLPPARINRRNSTGRFSQSRLLIRAGESTTHQLILTLFSPYQRKTSEHLSRPRYKQTRPRQPTATLWPRTAAQSPQTCRGWGENERGWVRMGNVF